MELNINNDIDVGASTPETVPRGFKGVWIPREIWLDKELTALDKVILIEINSLDIGDEGCFASNEYLANFCQCSESKITKAISKLIKLGYLERVAFDGRTRTLKSSLVKNTRQPSAAETGAENVSDRLVKSTRHSSTKYEHNKIVNKIVNKKENCQEKKSPLITSQGRKEELTPPSPPKSKIGSFNQLIEEYTSNKELQDELKQHLKVRAAKKGAMTDHAIELELKTLDKLGRSTEEKIEIVKRSIVNGWIGFFRLPADRGQLLNGGKRSYDIETYESDNCDYDQYLEGLLNNHAGGGDEASDD